MRRHGFVLRYRFLQRCRLVQRCGATVRRVGFVAFRQRFHVGSADRQTCDETAGGSDQAVAGGARSAGALQVIDPASQRVVGHLQQRVQIGIATARFGQALVHHLFDAPGSFAERHQADHAAASLERVEGAAQRGQVLLLMRLAACSRQRGADGFEDFDGFGQENLEQLGVDPFLTVRRRHRCQRFGRWRYRRQRGRSQQRGVGRRSGREVRTVEQCDRGLGALVGMRMIDQAGVAHHLL